MTVLFVGGGQGRPLMPLLHRSRLSVGFSGIVSQTCPETARRDPKREHRGLLTAVDRNEGKYGSSGAHLDHPPSHGKLLPQVAEAARGPRRG